MSPLQKIHSIRKKYSIKRIKFSLTFAEGWFRDFHLYLFSISTFFIILIFFLSLIKFSYIVFDNDHFPFQTTSWWWRPIMETRRRWRLQTEANTPRTPATACPSPAAPKSSSSKMYAVSSKLGEIDRGNKIVKILIIDFYSSAFTKHTLMINNERCLKDFGKKWEYVSR